MLPGEAVKKSLFRGSPVHVAKVRDVAQRQSQEAPKASDLDGMSCRMIGRNFPTSSATPGHNGK